MKFKTQFQMDNFYLKYELLYSNEVNYIKI
jgi:hypothetical protein